MPIAELLEQLLPALALFAGAAVAWGIARINRETTNENSKANLMELYTARIMPYFQEVAEDAKLTGHQYTEQVRQNAVLEEKLRQQNHRIVKLDDQLKALAEERERERKESQEEMRKLYVYMEKQELRIEALSAEAKQKSDVESLLAEERKQNAKLFKQMQNQQDLIENLREEIEDKDNEIERLSLCLAGNDADADGDADQRAGGNAGSDAGNNTGSDTSHTADDGSGSTAADDYRGADGGEQ